MKSQIKFLLPVLLFLVVACSEHDEKKTSDFYGYIECTQLNVTTRMPGKITAIYADEGDYVKKNQVVAQLDTKEMKAHRKALVARLKNIKVKNLGIDKNANNNFLQNKIKRKEYIKIILGESSEFYANNVEFVNTHEIIVRSEERRVGKECRSRWSP